MRYWRDKSYHAIKFVASEAATVAEWRAYAAYCSQMEQGLRKSALSILNCFIESMGTASFEERKRFVSWLMHISHKSNALNSLLPHPLWKQLIDPTLEEWKAVDPQASEPYRWLGGYENLKTALNLNPADDIARQKLAAMVVSGVAYEAHELPQGYIGNAREGYAELVEAAQEAFKLADTEERRQALSNIAMLKKRSRRTLLEKTLSRNNEKRASYVVGRCVSQPIECLSVRQRQCSFWGKFESVVARKRSSASGGSGSTGPSRE